MELLYTSFAVVFPVFALVLMGIILGRIKMLNEFFCNTASDFCYKVALPVLLFYNIYNSDINFEQESFLIIYGVLCAAVIAALSIFITPILVKDKAKIGAIAQAIIRSNFMLFGLPIAANLFGEENVSSVALLIAATVPVSNTCAIIALSIFSSDQKMRPIKILKDIITNPFVIASLLGVLFVFIDIPVHPLILDPLSSVSDMAAPLTLIVLGATFKFTNAIKNARYIVSTTIFRLIIIPVAVTSLAVFLGFRDVQLCAIFLFSGTPVGVNTFILAQAMGADSKLAGELIVFTALAACLTIFLFIYCFRLFGLFSV